MIHLSLVILCTLSSICGADASQFCFRKFSVERNACKGQVEGQTVTVANNDIDCCTRHSNGGYAVQLTKQDKKWFQCSPCGEKTNKQHDAKHDVITSSRSRDHKKNSVNRHASKKKIIEFTTTPPGDAWSLWTDWSDCTSTCQQRTGLQQRTRFCLAETCTGSDYEERICSLPSNNSCDVNGGWSDWDTWQHCTVTCGNGTEQRARVCNNPVPSGEGLPCSGETVQQRSCATHVDCPVDGGWSKWTDWNECNVPCGTGQQSRTRQCHSPVPANGGQPCTGANEETKQCHSEPCPVDGNWSLWSKWTQCTTSCGEGLQTRSRRCDNPVPQHGGKPCEGLEMESAPCQLNALCPVHGNWSDWSHMDACSAKPCSGQPGLRIRFRSCTNPRPMFGGSPCRGRSWRRELCYNNEFCTQSVDGEWCPWSDWSVCSDGLKTRSRACQCPSPVNQGAMCEGFTVESSFCGDHVTSTVATRLKPGKQLDDTDGSASRCHGDGSGDDSEDTECDMEEDDLSTLEVGSGKHT